jgi:hypothetical protein
MGCFITRHNTGMVISHPPPWGGPKPTTPGVVGWDCTGRAQPTTPGGVGWDCTGRAHVPPWEGRSRDAIPLEQPQGGC